MESLKLILFLGFVTISKCQVIDRDRPLLECYVCEGQDWNGGSCTRDRITCRLFQDTCTSYVRWSTPDYPTARGSRKHWISKGCDTMEGCRRRQGQLETLCRRDWYQDWACVDCCQGNLCNREVTLAATSVQSSVATGVASIFAIWYIMS